MKDHNFGLDSNIASLVLSLIIVCTLIFLSVGVVSAETGRQTDEIVVAKVKHFAEYQDDFLQFAKSGPSDESQIAMNLSATASQTGDYLSAVHTLLEIYGDLSCEEDRARIKPVIEREVGFYIKFMEPLIEEANLSIARTRMPGIAAEGTRMRDELREVKSVFDSIKLR